MSMSQFRFASKYFQALTLAALLVAAMPVTLKAQESAPQSAATSQPGPETAQKPEVEKKAETSEEDAFLLEGPIVKWVANTFHADRRTVSNGFQIFNFLIILLCVGVPLARVMPKIFRRRSESVRAGLEEARKASADAAERIRAIESKLSGLDTEIAAIRQQVEQESSKDEQRIKAGIEEEKTRIVASAEQEISVAAAQARRSLQGYAAELAIEQAARQVALTPEADKALIAEFLNGVGGKN